MRDEIIQKILDNKIIAIIRGLDADQAVGTARALALGGGGFEPRIGVHAAASGAVILPGLPGGTRPAGDAVRLR